MPTGVGFMAASIPSSATVAGVFHCRGCSQRGRWQPMATATASTTAGAGASAAMTAGES